MTNGNKDSSNPIRGDLMSVLQKAAKYIQRVQYAELKELSNHTIHNASIFQDEDSTSLAVVVYALSKLAERLRHIDPSFLGIIRDAEHDLETDDLEGYRTRIKAIFRKISQLDNKLTIYIDEVVEMGKIRKGSKLYDHGISLAQASQILGISQWELASYVGRTKTLEHSTPFLTKSRIDYARELFKGN